MAVQMGSDSGCGVPKLRLSLNLILIGEDGPFRERRAERRTERLQSGAGSNRPGRRIVHPPAVRHCRRAARRGLRKPLKITTLTGHSGASHAPRNYAEEVFILKLQILAQKAVGHWLFRAEAHLSTSSCVTRSAVLVR